MSKMAGQRSNENPARLVRALADLFDRLGPANRLDAEEELRSAGIEPARIGMRMTALADEMLGARRTANGDQPPGFVRDAVVLREPARRWHRRLLWAAAAGLGGCALAWSLLRPEAYTPMRAPAHTPSLADSPSQGITDAAGERGPVLVQRGPAGPRPPMAVRRETGPYPPLASAGETGTCPSGQTGAPSFPPQPAAPEVPASGDQAGLALADAVRGAAGATASIAAKTVVSADNLARHTDLTSPGVQWSVRNGLRMTVIDPRPVPLPDAYREATERYAGDVSLAADKGSLEHYVAGLPFPHIDPNDADAAVKIMWNYEYRPFASDDFQARHVELDTGTLGQAGEGMSIERRFAIESFERLFSDGRLIVDPRPDLLPNADRVRYREGLYPLREPADLRGVGEVTIRYQDAARQDDTWLYLPSLRRVRRLSAAQRSDALFGTDVDLDSLLGFSGQTSWMTWKLVGESVILGCVHARNDPVKWGAGSADFAFDDVWEPRRVYVLEGAPKLAECIYGKRVLYIDQETWLVLLSDIYDRAGVLWKVWLNMFSAQPPDDDSAARGGAVTNPAAVMIDTQLRHATRMSVPGGVGGAEERGWSFNRGDVSAEHFTIAAMIEAAR